MTDGVVSEGYKSPLTYWVGVVIAALHLYANTVGTLPELWVSALHYGTFAFLCALIYPGGGRKAPNPFIDGVLGLLVLGSTIYLIVGQNSFYAREGAFIPADWAFASIGILGAIILTKRTTGWVIPALIVIALSYVAWWGQYVPGVLHFPGLSPETVMRRSFFENQGMFGQIARISATYVFMFILFGAFLLRSGAGDFVIDLARLVAGKITGGPGFIAILGSGLTGMVTGSAVANTVTTGVFTIPLMRRAGFPARFAAGVEAAASSGGQLMPPVMGAGAFVMASYTNVPYLQIIGFALLPAVLYFLSVAFFVRIEAQRQHLARTPGYAAPEGRNLARRSLVFLIPVAVVIVLLVQGFTPVFAAGIGIAAVIAASWLGPKKMGPLAVLDALALGARNMASMAVLLVAIGLVVNAVTTTGLGTTFSLMIGDWAGGHLLVAIVLVALASLVLGMGLPVTAAYIVLATLSAPMLFDLISEMRLVEMMADGQLPQAARSLIAFASPEAGAALEGAVSKAQARDILAALPPDLLGSLREQAFDPGTLTALLVTAHMIIFWLSQDSNVTPPVCLAAFAAAAVAKSDPMRTGLTSWKVAKGLYIIPLLFAFTPLMSGNWGEALLVVAFAAPGLYALAGALEGHLDAPTGWILRIVLGALGVFLLWPFPWTWHALALIPLAAIVVANVIYARRLAARAHA